MERAHADLAFTYVRAYPAPTRQQPALPADKCSPDADIHNSRCT